MAIMMPNDVLARHTYVEQFEPLRQAYEQSVSEILSYERDPRVPEWLHTATEQFLGRAKTLQKLAEAQAWVVKLVPRVQKATSGMVTIRKHEGEPMSTAWSHIQKIAAESGCTVEAVCQSEPDLYRRHIQEVQRGEHLPPLQKRAEPPIASGAGATLIMLAQAKIAKGMSILQAYAEVARENPEQYKTYRLQSLGRSAS